MNIVKAEYRIITPIIPSMLLFPIEEAGRTCYKSEMSENAEDSAKFIKDVLIKRGHEAMLEHASFSVKFIVDRGISHEIVRHRMASYAQESTRYCNYSKGKFGNEITVIRPVWFDSISEERAAAIVEDAKNLNSTKDMELTDLERKYISWHLACEKAEWEYMESIRNGAAAQEARDLLPTSLKTEIVVTANIREWRHILKLRAAGITGKPHPQMLEVMVPLLNDLRSRLPALFEDIIPMTI